MRSEIFGAARFQQHGRSLAQAHVTQLRPSNARRFAPRLRANIRTLREAQHYIGAQVAAGLHVSPAAEWLLDNFHLIEAQLDEIHDGLPPRYYFDLPVLTEAHLAGLPRIYGVAWAFVAHTDSAFDETLLATFLAAYQEERELTLGELWALPTTLRVVLIENLRRLAERIATAKAAREVANLCADRIDRHTAADLDALLAAMQARGVAQPFLLQLCQRLDEARPPPGEVLAPWLAGALPDPAAAQAHQQAGQAADNVSVSQAISALRRLGDTEWRRLVGGASRLMRMMDASPAFQAERDDTQDATLHAIERLARRGDRPETAVARVLLDLMAGASGPDASAAAPGHWLHGPGSPALHAALGLATAWPVEVATVLRGFSLPAYLAALVVASVALVTAILSHHLANGGWVWLVGLLLLLPASEAAVAVVNRLISELARPARLPRLALAEGIPVEHRVLVAVPAMLGSDAGAAELAQRLELHHLANGERHAQFALLTDFADAATEHAPGDAGRLAAMRREVEALNARHPAAPGDPTRFLLLHRGRRFSQGEQAWIGWERKRGKLEALVDALATGSDGGFTALGDLSALARGTPYVLTLDSDTQLPPGRLRELVGVAAHPHNQPRLDESGRRVVGGYAILQPRIVTPLPNPDEVTPFHWLFAGAGGIDPYSAASSEVYQDLFGEGTFTGKGLLNVQALHRVLSGRLPEGRVLSHDLLEGSIARCAAVSDVVLVEEAPVHADVAASRVHRWTRGDWQLLPLLARSGHYGIRPINRWKMADNLRRSLVAPASLAALVLVFATGAVSPSAVLALVVAAFCAGPLLGALAGLAPNRDGLALRCFYRSALADVLRATCLGAWGVVQLLSQAMLLADAVLRALWRTAVSHRLTLQWTTAAAVQASAGTDLAGIARKHAPVSAVALVLGVAASLLPITDRPLALALCAAWALSPLATWWVSRPRRRARDDALPAADRDYLLGVARDTWRLFERRGGAEDHHLPPDNLQTFPHEITAHRSSPTNIGLYLLCTATARAFGWIDTAQMLARLEATLATLHRLDRHRGHFLNWYDTQTLQPLLPAYVSAVDSGNLSGHLLAVAQACLERVAGAEEAAFAERLRAVAETCQRLAWAPDFGFLFDPVRRLLHIGYRVAEQQLDSSCYDLLASESRLTSLLAIAKGDVPVAHWAALGRPFYALGSRVALRSWSGSMFEYLMPTLTLAEPRGSVLHDATRAAVVEQIAYGRLHDVPWGISESAYAATDRTLAYQYAPQGVPRLALRRTPTDERVIAPYATALAVQVDPVRAAANLRRIEALGARDALGFIEALDFTPERRGAEAAFARVSTFMAHHQGMSIVAIANVLLDGAPRRWGMADLRVQAVQSLLHERAPREVSVLLAPPPGRAPDRPSPGSPMQQAARPDAPGPQPTHTLSNGRYTVTIRADGSGTSQLHGRFIPRRPDGEPGDARGTFFQLRREGGPPHSITRLPAPDPAAAYDSTWQGDRLRMGARWPDLQSHCTVWVSPDDDIELRRIELRNLSAEPIAFELTSCFEGAPSEARADEVHLATGEGLHAVHFLATAGREVAVTRARTDRAGQAMGPDPLASISVRVTLAPFAGTGLTFATAAAASAQALPALVDQYRQPTNIDRSSLMSATLAGIRQREMRMRTPPSVEDIRLPRC